MPSTLKRVTTASVGDYLVWSSNNTFRSGNQDLQQTGSRAMPLGVMAEVVLPTLRGGIVTFPANLRTVIWESH